MSFVNAPVPAGYSTGCIPRDYSVVPVGSMAFAPEFPASELIDQSEWADRLNENRKTRSGLLELREDNYEVLRSLDQNGKGLCWSFSSTKATMYVRALMGEPLVRLSAWWVAGKVVNWRDQGYWGAASLAQIVKEGVPVESLCPSYSSRYDTQETRADAAKRKVTEWWDGSEDPREAQKQLVSMLLKRIPCVVDLNDMGHSMCAIDIKSLNPITIVYDNSWGDQGDKGLYYGTGARARPDGLVIPRVAMAA